MCQGLRACLDPLLGDLEERPHGTDLSPFSLGNCVSSIGGGEEKTDFRHSGCLKRNAPGKGGFVRSASCCEEETSSQEVELGSLLLSHCSTLFG